MKVSVVITTYNRAHIVTEAIDSILNQTFRDFELIIVDNESTDNTKGVIKSYTDERIRYFKHQNEGIIAVNRNYGVTKAQGEYIAFCDDDDLWMPEKLERQMLEFEKDSQIGLVCTNAINFDENGERGKWCEKKLKDRDFTFESIIWEHHIACCSVLVKKEIINDVGIMDESPEIVAGEDYEFWVRVAKKYKIKYIDMPLVKHRIAPGTSGKKYLEIIELHRAIYRTLLDKKVIDFELYQKRINKLKYESLLIRLSRYKWIIKIGSFFMRILRVAGSGIRRISGANQD